MGSCLKRFVPDCFKLVIGCRVCNRIVGSMGVGRDRGGGSERPFHTRNKKRDLGLAHHTVDYEPFIKSQLAQ